MMVRVKGEMFLKLRTKFPSLLGDHKDNERLRKSEQTIHHQNENMLLFSLFA